MPIMSISTLRNRNHGLMEGFGKRTTAFVEKVYLRLLLNVQIVALAGCRPTSSHSLIARYLTQVLPASCNNTVKISSLCFIALFV
jgi:hypothetical protein